MFWSKKFAKGGFVPRKNRDSEPMILTPGTVFIHPDDWKDMIEKAGGKEKALRKLRLAFPNTEIVIEGYENG